MEQGYLREFEWFMEQIQQNAKPQNQSIRIKSIFFGGGSPSLAPPELIHSIITKIKDTAEMTTECEISLEANPTVCELYLLA